MPLLLKKEIENCGVFAVWKVEEDNQFFIEQLHLGTDEVMKLDNMRPHRQKEWLSSRYLLHLVSGDNNRKVLIKDEHGKPSRVKCNKHIAISHSKNMVAVALASRLIGIDIQIHEDKISKIRHKFISDSEYERIPDEIRDTYYHIFWGAKESMYKAYGKKKLKFKEHMHLYPFEYMDQEFELAGWVRKDETQQNYTLNVRMLEKFYLIYSLLQNEK